MQNLGERSINSIYSYIVGDALGVPYEFQEAGSFSCKGFSEYGTHDQPLGTWSDDTSIMLCLMDSLCENEIALQISTYKENLTKFYRHGRFTINGLFDIGNQTIESIRGNFKSAKTNSMGNGALFYCLPLAIYLLNEQDIEERKAIVKRFVQVTHNNPHCVGNAVKLCELIRNALLYQEFPSDFIPENYLNQGDVINTTRLVTSFSYLHFYQNDSTLFKILCKAVNLGEDTDTNAALIGGVLGTKFKMSKRYTNQLKGLDLIEKVLQRYIDKLFK